jgi:limonene-1,2-epoxide hydrolase
MTATAPPPWVHPDTDAARPTGADERLVIEFLAGATNPDLEVLRGYLAPDVTYQNMPLPPIHGADAVCAALEGIFQILTMDAIDTHFLASRDGYVFTERTDHITARATGQSFPLPVSGVFRVSDGKITDWRDYFDLRAFEEGLGISLG